MAAGLGHGIEWQVRRHTIVFPSYEQLAMFDCFTTNLLFVYKEFWTDSVATHSQTQLAMITESNPIRFNRRHSRSCSSLAPPD
jgi:hypothetical protein